MDIWNGEPVIADIPVGESPTHAPTSSIRTPRRHTRGCADGAARPAHRLRGMTIGGFDVWRLVRSTVREIVSDKLTVYAAQMAYTLFFSLFPSLIFVVALISLAVDRQRLLQTLGEYLQRSLPTETADLLLPTARRVLETGGATGLLSFGLVTALWSGSAIFGSMTTALNSAYDVEETRPLWKRLALRLAAMVVSGIVLLVATVVLIAGEGVVNRIAHVLGLDATTRSTWIVVQYPLAIVAMIAALWMLYYFLPNRGDQRARFVLVSAMVTTTLWIAATLAFRWYVSTFDTVNPAYGAIGAIMLLLIWMYYSMFVLLAGGELNAELQWGHARVETNPAEPARQSHR